MKRTMNQLLRNICVSAHVCGLTSLQEGFSNYADMLTHGPYDEILGATMEMNNLADALQAHYGDAWHLLPCRTFISCAEREFHELSMDAHMEGRTFKPTPEFLK